MVVVKENKKKRKKVCKMKKKFKKTKTLKNAIEKENLLERSELAFKLAMGLSITCYRFYRGICNTGCVLIRVSSLRLVGRRGDKKK